MADRTIRTVLTLDPSQYESGMQRAAKASQGLGEANQKTATQSRSAMQRMAQSARDNRQAWTEVGGALAIAGGAVTGMMALVAKTGIEYNSLRQVATQSLIGVTGSIEGANEQMRRLDEYGQNSWLMRDTLVRAQQNMTGFGIETNKVVPYMEALAEAVAFAGGNNQTFEELAQVMGVIQSQGRITGRELERFAVRGVDAASLIGDAMGMTGAQIREQITAGALDAETALDALTQGMMMNFEGSSDLVRQTFRGATDDVAAAFRDLAAIAMAPLVDPEGGGLLTGLLNQASDLLYALQDLPDPIIQVAGALTGVGGLATLAAGGFMLLAPRLVETWDAAERLGISLPRLDGHLKGMDVRGLARGLGLAVTAMVGLAAAGRAIAQTVPDIDSNVEGLRRRFLDLEESGHDVATMFDDINKAWYSRNTYGDTTLVEDLDAFNQHLQIMTNGNLIQNAQRSIGNFIGVMDSSAQGQFEARIGQINDDLASLVQSGNADMAAEMFDNLAMAAGGTSEAGIELINAMPEFKDALIGVANESGMATDDVTLLNIALGFVAEEAEVAAVAVHGYEGAVEEAAAAQAEARDLLDEWVDSMGQAAASFGGIVDGYNAAAEAADSGTASMEDWIGEMQKQAEAVANWRENTLTASAQIRSDLPEDMQAAGRAMVDEMMLAGDEGAQALQTFVDGTPEQRQQLIEAWSGTGYDVGVLFAHELTSAPDGEIGADTFPAEQALWALLGAVAESEEDIIVNGNPVPAENVLQALRNQVIATDEDVTIDGNDVPARGVLDSVVRAIENAEEDVDIDGNRVPVDQVVGELMSWIGRQRADVSVSANTSAADRAMNNFMMRHNGRTLTTYQQVRVLGQGVAATGGYMGDFASAMGLAGGGMPKRLTGGGGIFGLGSGTSDSIPIWASKGEFMQRAAAVDKYGTDFMHAVNGLRFPVELARGLAGGGQVQARQYPAQYMPAPRSAGQVSVAAPSVQVYIGDEEVTGRVRVVVRDELDGQGRVARRGMRAGVGG